jgi:hypothetical protein
MNCNLNLSAGGIFSKYMFGIQNAIQHKCDSYYFNITDERTDSDMFNYVLDQQYDSNHQNINCDNLGSYHKLNPIENSSNYTEYVEVTKKLKFNKELLKKVKYYEKKIGIDDSTVGVHVRLTDMNIIHGKDYGVLSFENFKNQLNPDTKYFISSDNNESINKLKELYGNNINYVESMIRSEFENENSESLQLNNFKNPQFWIESFLEMLLLSKCGTLICRSSNLSNASIINSKTIKNIIRL